MLRKTIFTPLFFILLACGHLSERNATSYRGIALNTVKYAKGFTIGKTDSSTIITVFDPWKTSNGVRLEYNLVPRSLGVTQLENIIPVPVQRVICMSSSYIAFIDALSKSETVVGISGTNYVYSQNVNLLIDQDKVYDVGYEQGLNYERIAQLKPDVVLCYGIGPESLSYLNKLKEMGIKLMFIGDYLETDPLGKSEWIKVFGYLFGMESSADSIFNSIEKNYQDSKVLLSKIEKKPTVFLNLPFRDVWYFPGNDNYFVKIINDAGGKCVFPNFTGSISYPLGFEKAFEAGLSSDVWLNPGTAMSLSDIKDFDERLVALPPYKRARVFNNNLRMSRGGGNDFWESGTLHPDIILKDLIAILHPEVSPTNELYYYRELK